MIYIEVKILIVNFEIKYDLAKSNMICRNQIWFAEIKYNLLKENFMIINFEIKYDFVKSNMI